MLYIHGIGHFRPENIIDNKFLENLDIGTNNQWILERVGIQSRRTVLDLSYIKETKNQNPLMAAEASLHTNAETGAFAAKMALINSNIRMDEIGMVIAGGCSPQSVCPAEACTIASELGIEVPAVDLGSACSSIAAQLHFLSMMDSDKTPDYILIVNPENSTRCVDYSDRASAVLWGDCTTAMIVSTKHVSKYIVKDTLIKSSPKGHNKVVFQMGGHFTQEGRTVQTFAIKKSLAVLNEMRKKMEPKIGMNVKYIGHQANLLMLDSVCRMAEIKQENHYFNVDRYGNCGAAGAVSVLSENIANLKSGDNAILAVVGSGLTWGGIHLEIN